MEKKKMPENQATEVKHEEQVSGNYSKELLDAALQYAAKGIPVFACEPSGKKPATPNGFKDATIDPVRIQRMWKKCPGANIGIPTGQGTFYVVDVDVGPGKDGEKSLAEFEAEHGKLPATLRSRTGGGGFHLCFSPADTPVGNSNSESGWLGRSWLDFRGDGGYVIVPPSRHASGNPYIWEEGMGLGESEMAPLPEPLIRLYESKRKAKKGERKPGKKGSIPIQPVLEHFGIVLNESRTEHIQCPFPDRKERHTNDDADPSFRVEDNHWVCTCSGGHLLGARKLAYRMLGGSPDFNDPESWRRANATLAELGLVTEDAEDVVDDDSHPSIMVSTKQFRELDAAAWNFLIEENNRKIESALLQEFRVPTLFRQNQLVVSINPQLVLEPVTKDALYGHLALLISWYKKNSDDSISPARPPARLETYMLANPHSNLPEIENIIHHPAFDAEGQLISTTGYSSAIKCWLQVPEGLLEIPADPSEEEVAEAKGLLLNEVLVDFPFAGEADQAHAIALLFLPFARNLISGNTPIHLIEASSVGSGKTLVANVASIISTGKSADIKAWSNSNEEIRKTITSQLLAGQMLVTFDNIPDNREFHSPALSAAVTAEYWSDRILGESRMVYLSMKSAIVVTGNNIQMSLELARRSIRIRLQPSVDRPWERRGFKHENLLEWVRENRMMLMRACLVLIQRWIAQGQPEGAKPLGSFESWAKVMGGILQAVGIPGFLENLKDMYEAVDSQGEEWQAFIAKWWGAKQQETGGGEFETPEVPVTGLVELAHGWEMLSSVLGHKGTTSMNTRLGQRVKGMRNRIFDLVGEETTERVQLDFRSDARSRRSIYKLRLVETRIHQSE